MSWVLRGRVNLRCRTAPSHASLEDARRTRPLDEPRLAMRACEGRGVATVDEVLARLEAEGIAVDEQRNLPNGQVQVWTRQLDACVNVWANGTCSVQGADAAELEALLGDLVGTSKRGRRRRPATSPAPSAPRSVPLEAKEPPAEVFVVYGHDAAARTQLEAMLRRWHCEPLILDQLPSEGATIIEKLAKYQEHVGFGVVLATPDDPAPGGELRRARQNVVLELGMLLTKLGRERVAILLKSPSTMERPSDIDGLIYLGFSDNVEEVKVALAREMEARGYVIPVGRL